VRGERIRLGDGYADVTATRSGNRYTTTTDTREAPVETFRIGHTLPRGSTVASVTINGEATTEYTTRETNRGLEVRVEGDAGLEHTLEVVAAPAG
jgi:hypothetical protein